MTLFVYCSGASNSCGPGGVTGYMTDITTGRVAVFNFGPSTPGNSGASNCALGGTSYSLTPTASTGLTAGDTYQVSIAIFESTTFLVCYDEVTDSNVAITGTPAVSTTTTTLTSTTTESPITTTITATSTSTVTSTTTALSTTTATSTTTSIATDTSTVTSTTTSLSTTTATTTAISTTTVNSPHDSTITKLSCTPTSVAVNVKTTCTAKITDDGPAPTLPSGTVSFSSTGSGTFGTVSCTSSASTKTLTCKATFAPASIPAGGSETISATYQGDSTHDKSLGTFKLKVT